MNREEMIGKLRAIEKRLYEDEWVDAVKQLEPAQRDQMVEDRSRLTDLIDRLGSAELETIRTRLESHADELNQGIARLEHDLQKIEQAAEVVRTLTRAIGLLTKIVGLQRV